MAWTNSFVSSSLPAMTTYLASVAFNQAIASSTVVAGSLFSGTRPTVFKNPAIKSALGLELFKVPNVKMPVFTSAAVISARSFSNGIALRLMLANNGFVSHSNASAGLA